MTILTDKENVFNKFQNSFHNKKMLSNLRIVENLLNLIKRTYEKCIAKTIFNSEILILSCLKSGTKKGCPFLSPIVNTVLEVVAIAIKQCKRYWKGRHLYL